ncbi:MAG: sulfatase-like hydrolase/transferase [Natronomonas sp.]|uniref:sulfatase-like hydrolase/transferase n=1 Tax=Natronomonas sp. TaxID=2184060 RepID=UPI00286FBFBE|nr:sulfatase-like hydrolase/transferase [Natronomonas sp.]MDR9431886.1 sulfatase-like hydrolase/transferase [Natronomonas sp.]
MYATSNVLHIQADQHRFDCLGVNGGRVQTPNLDSLAADGVNFTNAYTPSPICTPERASLMTGQWPSQHGIVNLSGLPGGGPLPPDATTFSDVLDGQGYQLRYVGRWHLGKHTPEAFGFDEWIPNGEYEAWRFRQGLPARPDPDAAWQDDEEAPERTPAGENPWLGKVDEGIGPEESRLSWAADRVISQLEVLADQDEPFLLRWDTWEPHLPNVVPEPYASMYDPGEIDPWPNFDDDLADKPWIQGQQRRTWHLEDATWEDWAPTVARYLGEITLLDAQISRVLDRLEALGLEEETLVVYTADHGDMCGSHGMLDKHFVMYDEVTRVPLIARWPDRIEPGWECDDFVSNAIDLPPTYCDVADAPVPDQFQGQSLVPLFGDATGRDSIFATYYGCQLGLYTQRMVRTEDWKYVWNATSPDELYHLADDPHERTNLAHADAHADRLAAMRRRLRDWLRETGDDVDNPWVMGQLDESEWAW